MKYGLELTTYESGYAEVEQNETPEYQQFLIDVQRQPELYEIELANYQNFKDAGGGLYMNFGIIGTPSKWGSWSALEFLYQETSPRYQALVDWNAKVAPWYEAGRDPRVFDSLSMEMNNDASTNNSHGGRDTTASVPENAPGVTTVTAISHILGQTEGLSSHGGLDAGNGFDTQTNAATVQDVASGSVEGSSRNNVIDVVHSVSGQPLPTYEEKIIDGGGGSGALVGGLGRDTFVFDLAKFAFTHREFGVVNHVVDYQQGIIGNFNPVEGDTFVFSAVSIGSEKAAFLKTIQDGTLDGHLTPITDTAVPAHFGNWYV